MNERDIAEQAYKNGYEKGYADGKAKAMEKIAFPRFLVRQTELSKKDVEDILMQSPTIIMDKTEIIPISPYRWIPVTERLPEDDLPKGSKVKQIKVLTALRSGKGVITVRSQTRYRMTWYPNSPWGWKYSASEITHWMPLPEPPKGEYYASNL